MAWDGAICGILPSKMEAGFLVLVGMRLDIFHPQFPDEMCQRSPGGGTEGRELAVAWEICLSNYSPTLCFHGNCRDSKHFFCVRTFWFPDKVVFLHKAHKKEKRKTTLFIEALLPVLGKSLFKFRSR